MSDVTTASQPTAAAVRTPRLGWPPPGLELMQGAIWPVIVEFCLGSMVLSMPILFAVTTRQQFWSLGAFGGSWWIPVLTSVLALLLLVSASVHLSKLLRRAAAASRLGYGIGTIATVVTDGTRDSGFVLQGARHFSGMPAAERRTLLVMRVTGAFCYLGACLWIPLGLSISIFLAATTTFSNTGMWTLTLLPATVLGIVGTLARGSEQMHGRRARKRTAYDVDSTMQSEAGEWTENLELIADDVSIGSRNVMRPRSLTFTAAAVLIPAVLLIIPVTAVVTSAAMGPVIAMISVPRYGKLLEKFAVANTMREYRLPFDSTITAQAAGTAFSNLSHVGSANFEPLMRPPAVQYPDWPVPPRGANITDFVSGNLFVKIRKGLKPEEKTYITAVAQHPAQAEYAVLGHAMRADILGGRLIIPVPDTMAPFNLPLPRFGRVRESAYIHVIKAGYEFSQGHNDDAERTLKEVISAGLLLMDESTTMIDALIGNVIMGIGVYNLEMFYRASGRVADADNLKAQHDAAEKAAEYARLAEPSASLTQASMQAVTDLVVNEGIPRGVRWEYFMTFNSFASCLNLQNVVFGPGDDYDAWIAKARSELVRYPSEADVFELYKVGLFGTRAHPAMRCVPNARTFKLIGALGI